MSCRLDRTVVASFHPRQRNERTTGDVIVNLLPTNDESLVCALSNGSVKVYDKSTLQLISTMQAADHLACASVSASVVVAASVDGAIAAFDLRLQQRHSCRAPGNDESTINHSNGVLYQRITHPGTITSMDGWGETTALGGSLGIHVWDWRQPQRVILWNTTHQNVTQVRFVHRHQLVSAGDSLLCVLDCSKPNHHEIPLCMMYTGKSTSDVKKLGFCGDDMVYCVSTENDVSLFDLAKGRCFHQTGIHHLRQKTRSTNLMNSIVDCSYDKDQQTLSLLASNYSGDASVFELSDTTAYHAHWQPSRRLIGGHRGMVTAWTGNVTGGTDARICQWAVPSTLEEMAATGKSCQPFSKRQRYDVE